MTEEKNYIAIDLKSFYASAECVERGLNPLDVNLVVADVSRTEKTICLAVSPTLKAYGLSGRSRLFEVVQKVKQINAERLFNAPEHRFSGESSSDKELKENSSLKLSYIAAPPRMAVYLDYSARIYSVYKKYVSAEDILVYSVDEVFIDATDYLKLYKVNATELARLMVKDVLNETGITATVGIGSNLYLAKVAMDVYAKRIAAGEFGERIAELSERTYREKLWEHKPLTDFWRIGRGIAKRLNENGMFTMGDVALRSVKNEDLLYKLFGVNAELIIDHAWGYEPTEIKDAKNYRPLSTSISSGQVLLKPYDYKKARLVLSEMAESLSLDMVEKGLVAEQVVVNIGYDVENLLNPETRKHYDGKIAVDGYGRETPEGAHGSFNLDEPTSSTKILTSAALNIYDKSVNKTLTLRRLNVCYAKTHVEGTAQENAPAQLNMFCDFGDGKARKEEKTAELKKERSRQETVIAIRKKYGKNAVFKGMDLEEGATARERNNQIGGHKA